MGNSHGWRNLTLNPPDQGGGITEEPFLLAHQIRNMPGRLVGEGGAGVGPLSLVLSQYRPELKIVAMELQHPLTQTLAENVKGSGLASSIYPVSCDIRFAPMGPVFDGLAINPPFFPVGSGIISPDPVRCLSRHELACTPIDVTRWAFSCLVNDGWLALILPEERYQDYQDAIGAAGLYPVAERKVIHQQNSARKGVLVLACKGILKSAVHWRKTPFVVRNQDGALTEEGQQAIG